MGCSRIREAKIRNTVLCAVMRSIPSSENKKKLCGLNTFRFLPVQFNSFNGKDCGCPMQSFFRTGENSSKHRDFV